MNIIEKTNKWVGECLRKKRLKNQWADNIIERAAAKGNKMYKYYCTHCCHYHVTKMKVHNE